LKFTKAKYNSFENLASDFLSKTSAFNYLFSAERLVDAEMVAVEQRKSEVDVNPHARVVAGLVWGTSGACTRQAASPYKVNSQHLCRQQEVKSCYFNHFITFKL